MASSLFDLKFIVVSGKGGVGRTVVAAALARAAASQGLRVLVAQTNAVERLGKMLGRGTPIGSTTETVAPGIDAVNMTPKESLHQYGVLVLKYETVYRALFENRAVRGFLSAIPGLDSYAMLGKAWWHTTEMTGTRPERNRSARADANEAGTGAGALRPKYDLVILDGPASGHAVAMLKIPQAIIAATPTGPLVKDARALHDLLVDPTRSALVIVTRAEELPAQETRELVLAARTELGMPIGPLIVNAVPPVRLSEGAVSTVLDRLPAQTGDVALDATVKAALGVRTHRRTAEKVIADLRADVCDPLGVPLVTLPWLPSTDLGLKEIDQLAAALRAAPDRTVASAITVKDVR